MSDNSVKDRDALRRLMTHLAQRSGRLPESMVLTDVTYHQAVGDIPRAVAGGSFADVYRGKHQGEHGRTFVAIKQLRLIVQSDTIQKRIKVRRSSSRYSAYACDRAHSKCTSRSSRVIRSSIPTSSALWGCAEKSGRSRW